MAENNKNKIHIIDNKTGFCKTCNKYENKEKIEENYFKLTSVSNNDLASSSTLSMLSAKVSPKPKPKTNYFTKTIRFQSNTNCDLCSGECSDKLDIIRFFESLCYIPLWTLLLFIAFYCALVGSTIYVTVDYVTLVTKRSYAGTCNVTSDCNTGKGLFCRSKNATTDGNCNCPALSIANMCDCSTNNYWNGSVCSPVYKYSQGPCVGDYSCEQGTYCNQLTGNCSCPSINPSWDSVSKSCNYLYKGCFTSCFNSTQCDYALSDCVITGYGYATPKYEIDLDMCLSYCSLISSKYAHLDMNTTSSYTYRCCCSSSFNKTTVAQSDTNCNLQCFSGLTTTMSTYRCPKGGYRSSFQIDL